MLNFTCFEVLNWTNVKNYHFTYILMLLIYYWNCHKPTNYKDKGISKVQKKSKQTMAKSCLNFKHKTWKSKQNIKYAKDSTLTKGNENFYFYFYPF
jgi:hypothetical protein